MTIRLSHATSPNQSTNACVRLIIDHLLPVGVQGCDQALMITARATLRPAPLPPLCHCARDAAAAAVGQSRRFPDRSGAGRSLPAPVKASGCRSSWFDPSAVGGVAGALDEGGAEELGELGYESVCRRAVVLAGEHPSVCGREGGGDGVGRLGQ